MRITKQQIVEDLAYLEENIELYSVNEDDLINNVIVKMRKDNMSIREFLLWSMEDIFYFVFTHNDAFEVDRQFLLEDERALEICKRYKLETYKNRN